MNQLKQRNILSRTNVGAEVISLVHSLATGSILNLQMRVRIGLYLAASGLCVYPMSELQASGSSAGMNHAEMAANAAGTSHDAQATACLAFVDAVVHSGPALHADQYHAMTLAGFSQEQILEVITQVTTHILLARLCAAVSTQGETANCIPVACIGAALA